MTPLFWFYNSMDLGGFANYFLSGFELQDKVFC